MLVKLQVWPSNLTCISKLRLVYLVSKEVNHCILFISLSIGLLFKLAIISNYLFVCQFSVIGDIIQKVQCHHHLIKAYAVQ